MPAPSRVRLITPDAFVANSVAFVSSDVNVHWFDDVFHVYHWFVVSLWSLNFAPWMVLVPSAALIFLRLTSKVLTMTLSSGGVAGGGVMFGSQFDVTVIVLAAAFARAAFTTLAR